MAAILNSIHICDDWITAELSKLETIHSLGKHMREEGSWTEVVGGLNSIAVQFDPALLDPNEALALFEKQMGARAPQEVSESSEIQIPVCYHSEFGLDCAWIAERLKVKPGDIADWHSGFKFTVAMLGFMPGFGYLQTESEIPEIGRLPQPRQNVVAGSIGITGKQSCIYSFDSPGGWPIIGRTAVKLFNAQNPTPSLLLSGQTVRFTAISKSEFEDSL